MLKMGKGARYSGLNLLHNRSKTRLKGVRQPPEQCFIFQEFAIVQSVSRVQSQAVMPTKTLLPTHETIPCQCCCNYL